MLARRDGPRVRLFTRNGYDWTERFPLIRVGMAALRVRSCLIDGEAVCCEVDGVPSFELLRFRHHDGGRDLRRAPLEERRAALVRLLRQVKSGVHLSEHVEADGPIVFRHACALGVEGVVSKRKGFALPLRAYRRLDQGQEPGLACGQARCRRI
jgi:bifunctional non-homologous end joining protein LigD